MWHPTWSAGITPVVPNLGCWDYICGTTPGLLGLHMWCHTWGSGITPVGPYLDCWDYTCGITPGVLGLAPGSQISHCPRRPVSLLQPHLLPHFVPRRCRLTPAHVFDLQSSSLSKLSLHTGRPSLLPSTPPQMWTLSYHGSRVCFPPRT